MKNLLFLGILIMTTFQSFAQDTITIQTLTFDSTARKYHFDFPDDDGTTYEKILMEYTLRCKDALVSTGQDRNKGCGEWDYSCNTYITDPAQTDSVKARAPSHLISGFSGEKFQYSNDLVNKIVRYTQKDVSYSEDDNSTTHEVGNGNLSISDPFGNTMGSKSIYLFTQNELTTAGFSEGKLSGISMVFDQVNQDARFMKIRIKATDSDVLAAETPETEGFEEVYFKNTNFSIGQNKFVFYKDFDWDGTSNLLIELSYTNTDGLAGTTVKGHNTPFEMALISSPSNSNILFNGSEYIDIPVDGFDISNEITISLWSFGNPNKLPRNTYIFEGVNDKNERQINVHLPWNNSTVYWDCGPSNRLEKAASKKDFAGQWNHWAFTKNATAGIMKIYLNGEKWAETSSRNSLIDLKKLTLAASKDHKGPYFGNIDEFRIWNKALSGNEIKNWMYKSIDETHPSYNALVAYYQFNEVTGLGISDSSPKGATTTLLPNSTRNIMKGENIFKDFTSKSQRPNIGFIQDDREKTIMDVFVDDTIALAPNLVVSYMVENNDLIAVDSILVWESGYAYVYDEMGLKIDSSVIDSDGSIEISMLDYYQKTPMEFEIMSFVTPYGIGLDLGENGKTFTFDVSDFDPILKGNKQLEVKFGKYQEEMDIKFKFIKGTPARKVLSIQQIWKAGQQRNFNDLNENKYFEERTVSLDPNAETYKMKVAVTGHGQQGEFVPRDHYININGDFTEYEWQVWTKCSDNPIYPQGGTWVYARAGWCPGAATDMEQFELKELESFEPGDDITIDYGIDFANGDSRYLINCQLVSYAPASFKLDAAITKIIRPTTDIEGARFNPVCHNLAIIIENTGADVLKKLLITYGVKGGKMETKEWKGFLELGESKIVKLSVPNLNFWMGSENTFIATVSNPNDSQDEYGQNNTMTSSFELPDMYKENFAIHFKTNKNGFENSYTIRDVKGDVVFSRNGLGSNKLYRDTLDLPKGCYTFILKDTGNDGIEWWANPNQGKGSIKLRKKDGTLITTFNPDFGADIHYSFVIGEITSIQNTHQFSKYFDVAPNPTDGKIVVDLELESISDINISIINNLGVELFTKSYSKFQSSELEFDLSQYSSGIYYIQVRSDDGFDVRKVVLK